MSLFGNLVLVQFTVTTTIKGSREGLLDILPSRKGPWKKGSEWDKSTPFGGVGDLSLYLYTRLKVCDLAGILVVRISVPSTAKKQRIMVF